MQKILWILPVVALLGGCEGMTNSQVLGTAGGAVIGAAVTPDNAVTGALLGSAVGLAAGSYLGHDSTGQCTWQRPDGSRYYAACP
jgi:hypothetical protein